MLELCAMGGTLRGDPWFSEALFDGLPDVVFFLKDVRGRYTHVNTTLVKRCGVETKEDLVGKTATEVFPSPLGQRFEGQDQEVIDDGVVLQDRLERHRYPDGSQGWCITSKVRILDEHGAPVGLAGLSRDVHDPEANQVAYERLARALDHMQRHFDQPLRVADLAAMAEMSLARFERMVRRLFHVTPTQLIRRQRLEVARRLLATTNVSIAEVAHACGFADHSAFTRQFRSSTGTTPSQYRSQSRAPASAPQIAAAG